MWKTESLFLLQREGRDRKAKAELGKLDEEVWKTNSCHFRIWRHTEEIQTYCTSITKMGNVSEIQSGGQFQLIILKVHSKDDI